MPKQRNETRLFNNGVHEVPFSVDIQYTEQWVCTKIDESYESDWKKKKKIMWNKNSLQIAICRILLNPNTNTLFYIQYIALFRLLL